MIYFCTAIALGMFGYELYYTALNPHIYTGLGKLNWLAASAMVDFGAGLMLYMLIKTLTAKRIRTAKEVYKEYTRHESTRDSPNSH